jgi:TPR repeat protein
VRRLAVLAFLLTATAALAQARFPAELLPDFRGAVSQAYEEGVRAERAGRADDATVLYWRAAQDGDANAALRLAEIYEAKDELALARDWHARALRLGSRLARQGPLIGTAEPPLYHQASEAEREGNHMIALRLYRIGAQEGDGRAAFRMGEIYELGLLGIPRDDAQAFRWYNAARVLGYTASLYWQAGRAELSGKLADAIQIYTRIAGNGNAKAAYRLGEIYADGLGGTRRDDAESARWFNVARDAGYWPEPPPEGRDPRYR